MLAWFMKLSDLQQLGFVLVMFFLAFLILTIRIQVQRGRR